MATSYKEKLKKVSTFMFDVDGVFTDSKVYLLPDGNQMRTMSIRDGYAVKFAINKGYRICIISGGNSEAVRSRFNLLGVEEVYIDVQDKEKIYAEILDKHGLKNEEILYMGDDLPDYEVIKKAGISCCPFDAVHEILNISDYISDRKGGNGCVRDIIEQTLRVQGNWFKS